MKPIVWVIGLGVVGLGLLALGAEPSDKPGGKPGGKKANEPPLPIYDTPARTAEELMARQAALKQARPDASNMADGYSRHRWTLVNATDGKRYLESELTAMLAQAQKDWENGKITKLEWLAVPRSQHTFSFTEDEYGRPAKGVPSDQLGFMLQAAGFALPFIPGVGPAASAALAGAIALGQGKSLKDAALAAIRGALPLQAQVAFDLGIAVASGEPVDEAAKNALLEYVPGGKEAYNQAKDAWNEVKGYAQ